MFDSRAKTERETQLEAENARLRKLLDEAGYAAEEAEVHGAATEEKIRFQASLLDAVEQAVIATDSSGTVLYWNRFAEGASAQSNGEAPGQILHGACAHRRTPGPPGSPCKPTWGDHGKGWADVAKYETERKVQSLVMHAVVLGFGERLIPWRVST